MSNEEELFADGLGPDGIFLRAADRRRFDFVLRAVRDEGASLALSSTNDEVLDHYGRLVIKKLRLIPDLQVEVFLPANTEALLDRFNEILAGLSLTDARNAASSPAPRRVMIAHDGKAISARDLQLIARLIQDFPGANTSLVMLLDRAGSNLHEKTLENFGQRMLRWPVDPPTRAEGDTLIKVSRALGFEVEVKKLLSATGFTAEAAQVAKPPMFAKQLAAARQQNLSPPSGRTEPVFDDAVRNDPPAASPKPAFSTPRTSRSHAWLGMALRWMAAIVLLMMVSGGVIALLFPQRLVPLLTTSPLLKDNLPPWMMDGIANIVGKPTPPTIPEQLKPEPDPVTPAPAVPPTPPAAVANENVATASVPPASSDIANKDNATAEPAAAKAAPAVPAKIEPFAKVAPVTPIDPVMKIDPAAKIGGATNKIEPIAPIAPMEPVAPAASVTPPRNKLAPLAEAMAPRSERGVEQLVDQAKSGSYFVQHVSLTSMAEAQEWRAQYPALKKSLIAAVSTQDQSTKFAVVSGPFASRKEAEVFAARQGVPPDPWLRPLSSLQKAIQPGNR